MDWRNMPPLNALRAFSAFHQTGNMVAAGAQLNVTHAAVSQQIKALEGHLGLALLDRSARQAALTKEGWQLAQALDQGFGLIRTELEELTEAVTQQPLHITTTPSFAGFWLMPRLAGFRDLYPETDLMLNATPKLIQVGPGGADIAIRYGDGIWPGADSHMLLASPLAVVASEKLIGGKKISQPSDLAEFPWLQELGTTESSDWLRRNGSVTGRGKGLVELPGNLMLDAARDGQGVMVTVRAFIEADIKSGRLKLLFQEDEGKGYHMVTPQGSHRPALREFATWLTRQVNL